MEKTISIKELRTNMPAIRTGLEKGITYTIIYRSRPIGKLTPLEENWKDNKDFIKLFANPPKELLIKSKKSAVELVREERAE
ncbi:hypothetical protein KKC88_00990 [Patescibacteria group bacterium]|nr:hypothetical protein [Patescibacteria group bacterium]MBU1673335.1 hypothetical protein [Patescibacteria group bacterium]MBU1963546.1 hypothetical protein [Patescibacteria group bacterium]